LKHLTICTVVGARPQFIKAAAVSRAIADLNRAGEADIAEYLLHTGQHFDFNMSGSFFEELQIPKPNKNLDINSGTHAEMTAHMLVGIERTMVEIEPDMVLVYGDTNSTLAGSLAAAKLKVPVAHVEAGLRSFNMAMPEEVNRILTDRVSSLLFCPTATAVDNLGHEGITAGIHLTGDVMYDVALRYREIAERRIDLAQWQVRQREFVLCTIHRAENTDDPARLRHILAALGDIARDTTVLFPIHPRTRKAIAAGGLDHLVADLAVIAPVGYLEMVRLEAAARAILTDSGGVQKEAFFHGVPCLTLRDETEWVETIAAGRNVLCGADRARIGAAWRALESPAPTAPAGDAFGDGTAARKTARILANQA